MKTNVLEQGRAAVADQPFFEGRKNAYECDGEGALNASKAKSGCGAFIVTLDRDAGVTPFMLKCGRCGAYAHSKFYRVAEWLKPTHEWYRPDSLDGIDAAYHEHLSKGGLMTFWLFTHPDGRWIKGEGFTDAEAIAAAFRSAAPPTPTQEGPGHVCKHGIRWPHPCDDCDSAAWEARNRKEDDHAE
jgi:hypothetical protein